MNRKERHGFAKDQTDRLVTALDATVRLADAFRDYALDRYEKDPLLFAIAREFSIHASTLRTSASGVAHLLGEP